jgi:hypothetical protein
MMPLSDEGSQHLSQMGGQIRVVEAQIVVPPRLQDDFIREAGKAAVRAARIRGQMRPQFRELHEVQKISLRRWPHVYSLGLSTSVADRRSQRCSSCNRLRFCPERRISILSVGLCITQQRAAVWRTTVTNDCRSARSETTDTMNDDGVSDRTHGSSHSGWKSNC